AGTGNCFGSRSCAWWAIHQRDSTASRTDYARGDIVVTQISLTVNRRTYEVIVPPMKRLLDVLRDDLALTGTKEGCGEGECGACTAIMDGLLVLTCMVHACQAAGRHVITIEGLSAGIRLHPLQQAFHENGGAQCGICTPGMTIAAAYYLEHPDEPEDLGES